MNSFATNQATSTQTLLLKEHNRLERLKFFSLPAETAFFKKTGPLQF